MITIQRQKIASGVGAWFTNMLRNPHLYLSIVQVQTMAVFEVLPPSIAKMPRRAFTGELRGCTRVEVGRGLQLTSPPTPVPGKLLVVVVLQVTLALPRYL